MKCGELLPGKCGALCGIYPENNAAKCGVRAGFDYSAFTGMDGRGRVCFSGIANFVMKCGEWWMRDAAIYAVFF